MAEKRELKARRKEVEQKNKKKSTPKKESNPKSMTEFIQPGILEAAKRNGLINNNNGFSDFFKQLPAEEQLKYIQAYDKYGKNAEWQKNYLRDGKPIVQPDSTPYAANPISVESLRTPEGRRNFNERMHLLESYPQTPDIQRQIANLKAMQQQFFAEMYGNRPDPLAGISYKDANKYLGSIPGYNNNDAATMKSIENDALTSIYSKNKNGLMFDENGRIIPTAEETGFLGTKHNGNIDYKYSDPSIGGAIIDSLYNKWGVFTTTPEDAQNNKIAADKDTLTTTAATLNSYTLNDNPSQLGESYATLIKFIKDYEPQYLDLLNNKLPSFQDNTEAIKRQYPSVAYIIDNYTIAANRFNDMSPKIMQKLNDLSTSGDYRSINSFIIAYCNSMLGSKDKLTPDEIKQLTTSRDLAMKYNGPEDANLLQTQIDKYSELATPYVYGSTDGGKTNGN